MRTIAHGIDIVFDFFGAIFNGLFNLYAKAHRWVETKRGASIAFVTSLLILTTLALASCATLKENDGTVKLSVQYAVIKLAEQSSSDKRVSRLNNIKQTALAAKALAANDQTTVIALRNSIAAQIAQLNLSPADALLANALADFIAEEIRDRIGEGILKPDDAVFIGNVMDWIIEACDIVAAI